jgi:predicted RNase H-like HicB family nuclease
MASTSQMKVCVVIEKDEDGYYAFCPELEGCQSQGGSFEEAMASIREAIELYLDTLTPAERHAALISSPRLRTMANAAECSRSRHAKIPQNRHDGGHAR